MSLSVLIEPIATGFRASMTSPLSISAEGPTEDAAMDEFREILHKKTSNGSHIRTIQMPDIATLFEIIDDIKDDTSLPLFMESLADVRKVTNAVPGDVE